MSYECEMTTCTHIILLTRFTNITQGRPSVWSYKPHARRCAATLDSPCQYIIILGYIRNELEDPIVFQYELNAHGV